MRWLSLAPLLALTIGMVFFFRIATISLGFRRWWIAWGILVCGTAFAIRGRVRNVIDIAWHGQPLELNRLIETSVAALCTCLFAVLIWTISKPRPAAPPRPIAQVVMDWQGNVIEWNDEAQAFLGWTKEEVYKKALADLIIPEGLMVTYHDQSISARDAHRLGLEHFRLTGESAIMNTFFYTTAQHKDGRLLEVEVRVTAHMSGLRQTFLGQLTLKPKLIA